jgi:hypothetical protein
MVIHGTRLPLTVLHVLWTAPENYVERSTHREFQTYQRLDSPEPIRHSAQKCITSGCSSPVNGTLWKCARGRPWAFAFTGWTFPVRDQTDHPSKREPPEDKTEYRKSLTGFVTTLKSYECRDERKRATPAIITRMIRILPPTPAASALAATGVMEAPGAGIGAA